MNFLVHFARQWLFFAAFFMLAGAAAAQSPEASSSTPSAATSPGSAASSPEARRWAKAPRVFGRIQAADLGLIINQDDPYSVKVGEHYAKARQLAADQILRVNLPVKAALTKEEFDAFSKRVNGFFGARAQALLMVWRLPYAVECNSITGALTMGFDGQLCKQTCAPSRASPYFGSATHRPYKDLAMRPSMLLAANDEDQAFALIDRGVRSDHSLGLRGAPPVVAHFVTTGDQVRSQRQVLFPPAGPVPSLGIDVQLDRTEALRDADRVFMYLTGRVAVDGLDSVRFVPGALADHLTSFGGMLDDAHGQMSVLSWIDAGATASYGTTSEPCAHLQKFPHPQALLLFYVQGASALEAYWKSVQWPQQGLFVGEPLAAPFAR